MFRDERLERRGYPRRERSNLASAGVPDRRRDEVYDDVGRRHVRPMVEIISHRTCNDETHFLHADEIEYEYLIVRSNGVREWLALYQLSAFAESSGLLAAYHVRLASRWSVMRGPVGQLRRCASAPDVGHPDETGRVFVSAQDLLHATSHFSATCRHGEEAGQNGFDVAQAETDSENGNFELEELEEQWASLQSGSSAPVGGRLGVTDFVDDEVVVVGEKEGRKRQSYSDGGCSAKRRRHDF